LFQLVAKFESVLSFLPSVLLLQLFELLLETNLSVFLLEQNSFQIVDVLLIVLRNRLELGDVAAELFNVVSLLHRLVAGCFHKFVMSDFLLKLGNSLFDRLALMSDEL